MPPHKHNVWGSDELRAGMVTAPGGSFSEPGPTTQQRVGRAKPMKCIHGAARRAAIAALGLCLAVPVTGFTSTAWAKSDQGASQSAAHGNGNGNGNGASADKGNNGKGKGSGDSGAGSSAWVPFDSSSAAVSSAPAANSAPAASSGGNGAAAGQTDQPPGCPNTYHNNSNGGGANTTGAYDSTCDGTGSKNGNSNGNANGKPCAGCVGNADDKNPPGQLPGPQDKNNGYECDGNNGIAKTNPAHTGCQPPLPVYIGYADGGQFNGHPAPS